MTALLGQRRYDHLMQVINQSQTCLGSTEEYNIKCDRKTITHNYKRYKILDVAFATKMITLGQETVLSNGCLKCVY